MSFECKRCHYSTDFKSNLLRHLKNKTQCRPLFGNESCNELIDEITYKKITSCQWCSKQFSTASNVRRHEKCCAGKTSKLKQNSLETNFPEVAKENQIQQNYAKKNKKKIAPHKRILCWNTYIGEEIGKTLCLCCKAFYITPFTFHCGHIIAEANGGSLAIENLRPVCDKCNISMGTQDMREFAKEQFDVEIE